MIDLELGEPMFLGADVFVVAAEHVEGELPPPWPWFETYSCKRAIVIGSERLLRCSEPLPFWGTRGNAAFSVRETADFQVGVDAEVESPEKLQQEASPVENRGVACSAEPRRSGVGSPSTSSKAEVLIPWIVPERVLIVPELQSS